MSVKAIQTQAQLLHTLRGMGALSRATRNEVICALIGHSRIQTTCFGYYYCGRCRAQVGDTIGSTYPGAEHAVVIGHDCEQCHRLYAELTWKDKLYVPRPFPQKRRNHRRKGAL